MTVTRICYKLSTGDNYIDLARDLSLLQRTMIRQKQTFTVLGAQVVDNTTGTVKISTAPNFWYVRAAINRCFKAWKSQRALALDNAELEDSKFAVGKFSDFKMTLNGSPTNCLPQFDNGGTTSDLAAPHEWAVASVIDELGTEKHFKIVGDHTGSQYGATKGWLQTRAIPDANYEPDMPDLGDGQGNAADGVSDYRQDFINLLNDTGTGQSERLTLVYEDNDQAPYALQNIYGNMDSNYNLQIQSKTYLTSTNPHHMVAGFKALCGLIHVKVTDGSSPLLFLEVHNSPEAF